jgi:hypothetical protein
MLSGKHGGGFMANMPRLLSWFLEEQAKLRSELAALESKRPTGDDRAQEVRLHRSLADIELVVRRLTAAQKRDA